MNAIFCPLIAVRRNSIQSLPESASLQGAVRRIAEYRGYPLSSIHSVMRTDDIFEVCAGGMLLGRVYVQSLVD